MPKDVFVKCKIHSSWSGRHGLDERQEAIEMRARRMLGCVFQSPSLYNMRHCAFTATTLSHSLVKHTLQYRFFNVYYSHLACRTSSSSLVDLSRNAMQLTAFTPLTLYACRVVKWKCSPSAVAFILRTHYETPFSHTQVHAECVVCMCVRFKGIHWLVISLDVSLLLAASNFQRIVQISTAPKFVFFVRKQQNQDEKRQCFIEM